jgi:glycosyltransferase involved in cell wall biosynthesis
MKVLHVIHQLSRGGAARSLIAVAKYSSPMTGDRHRAISLLQAGPFAVDLATDAGLEVLNAPDREAVWREMGEADIVQVHFWNTPEMYELLRSDLPAMRLLLHCHVAGDRPPQVITSALVEYADFILTSSPYTCELPIFQRLPSEVRDEKLGMVYSGADLARLSGIQYQPHERFNVGYIGTVDFVKLHPNYVRMSAAIRIPSIRFIVCGAGNGYARLKQQAQRLGVAERFDFRGYVEDIKPVIETLDVFGYPLCEDNYSTAELVLQEVMYAGVPPVIFAYGGAQRTIVHDETGLIVSSELEYRQAIEHLYHHPEERARLGENARAFARHTLGAENAAKQLHRIHERLMQRPKRDRDPQWIGRAAGLSGVEAFIRSLGEAAPQFTVSMTSEDVQELFEADRRIGSSSPVLCNSHGGGILHYRSRYPDDGWLRLWSGLVLHNQGQNAPAVLELTKAIQFGCDHWRVSWYLAQAAERVNAIPIAEKALQVVLEAAPDFTEAWQLWSRIRPHSLKARR